jgi:protein-L-isoaspartate(D-aspartate) O-methyltransferase
MNDLKELSPLEKMIQHQIVDRGITDSRVIGAIRTVPRECFFTREERKMAFRDQASPIGHGQTISQPYMVALMSQRLEIAPDHRILEIGTGSGYQTAILSKLATEVFTMERVKPLLDHAWERLMDLDCRNVHFRFGDGTLGWREAAPFDRILFTAGAPQVPERMLLEQLIDGGIAVLPIGPEEQQMLVRIIRHGDELDRQDICACRFVKLIGEHGWSAPTA